MFLLDNEVVRAGWNEAKTHVADIVEKYDGKVCSARRWDERRLCYPIRKKNRATFLLTYCEFPKSSIQGLRRDLDLSETIMRYLILGAEAVPESEIELTREESGEDFQIPEVPDDNAIDEPPVVEAAEGAEGSEAPKEAGATEEAKEGDAAKADAPADAPAEASAEASDATAAAPVAAEAPAATTKEEA